MRSSSKRSRRYSVTSIVSETAWATVRVSSGSRALADLPVPRWSQVATVKCSSSCWPA